VNAVPTRHCPITARPGFILLGVAALVTAAWPGATARAFPGRFASLPNGSVLRAQYDAAVAAVPPPATPPTHCTTCHTVTAPGTCAGAGTAPCLNATFGMPFQASGWTPALAAADLDGDGFTNGQELQDPTGTWTMGAAAPGIAAHVTQVHDAADHPGLHDADRDHVCWFGRDTNNDFLCTAVTEKATADRDCDDANPSRHTGASELCDGADQDCDGNSDEGLTSCDPGVGSCGAGQGQNMAGDCHPREQIDGDRDRFCHAGQDLSEPADWDCVDTGEQNGQVDCDEFDATRAPGAAEACTDGRDNDCDMLSDADDTDCAAYADGDDDGFCPLGEDMDADGQCDTTAEAASTRLDCDDAVAAINPDADEVCTGGADDDCDGLLDGRDEGCPNHRDEDRDGYCAAGRDGNGDSLCDGSGEQGTAADCDDTLPDVHADAPENCIDERDNDCDGDVDEDGSCTGDSDADEDGYCPLGRDLSDPPDGDCTDDGEDQAVSDCDDGDPDTNPAIVEACSDRADNDCDGRVDLDDGDCERLLDGDRDAYCPAGHDTNGDGDCLDFDEARPVSDCDDGDPERRPRAGESCNDGVDNDCNDAADGFDEACTCATDDDCPVSERCSIGMCTVGVGCRAVPDPECADEDGGAEGPDDPGMAGRPARDGGGRGPAGDGGGEAAELEDVGCGCRVVGARAPLATAPALASALVVLIAVRATRRRRLARDAERDSP
jgi:hypothetical protein